MEKEDISRILSQLPSVNQVLENKKIKDIQGRLPERVITSRVRKAIDKVRTRLSESGQYVDSDDLLEEVADESIGLINNFEISHYRKVINATGIILHTGLGRAVLSRSVISQLYNNFDGYSLLQLDIENASRAKRDGAVEELLCELTGAEAATVVNNNAAATAIVLNTFASGKEVIVSRGQLVEIGGAFRLPDVMQFSGAKLVEVGTTNKTHLHDYENAITDETSVILRVHPSNYKISGFSSEVPAEQLVKVAHKHDLLMIDDLGAGALIDFSQFGFEPEPTIQDSVKAGSDIITCSGDKLIGSAQAGIILGRKELIQKIRKNQFARIVRPGKLTLAALEATLKLFLDEKRAIEEIPTLKMLTRDYIELTETAGKIASDLKKYSDVIEVDTLDEYSQMGSGSLPQQNLRTRVVSVKPENMSEQVLAEKLRKNKIPLFTRLSDGKILLDPRTILPGQEIKVIEAFDNVLGQDNK